MRHDIEQLAGPVIRSDKREGGRRSGIGTRLAVVALFASGCASNLRDSLAQLNDSVEAYNEAYRWKNYERASMFVPVDLRAAFLAAYEDEENSLHIEDYQILKVDVGSESSAVVTIRVRYTLLPSVTIERKTVVQHWHSLGGAWILESEENSIRPLDPGKKPGRFDAADGEPVRPPEEGWKDPESAIEVMGPDGTLLRSEDDVP